MTRESLALAADHNMLANKFGINNVFAVCLYGSQNYGCALPSSDVDTKAILLPSFGDFALHERWYSHDFETPFGICIAKDMREMFKNFIKSNINFLEILFTDHYIVTPHHQAEWNALISHRTLIADADPRRTLRAAAGMAFMHYKNINAAEFALDPDMRKDLYHVMRLAFFIRKYFETGSFQQSLIPSAVERGWLIQVKKENFTFQETYDEAEQFITNIDSKMTTLETRFPVPNPDAAEFLRDFTLMVLRNHMRDELIAGAQL